MDKNRIIDLLRRGVIDEAEALEIFETFGWEMDVDPRELSEIYGVDIDDEDDEDEHADEDEDGDEDHADDYEGEDEGDSYIHSGFTMNFDKINFDKIEKKISEKLEKIERKFEKLGEKFEEKNADSEHEQKLPDYSIEIKLEHGDISLTAGDELSFRFINLETGEEEENPENIIVYRDDKKLKITDNFYKSIGSKVAFGDVGKKVINMIGLSAVMYPRYLVEVTIPRGRKYSLAKLRTVSGGVTVDGVNTVEKLDLNLTSGKLQLSDFIGDSVVVNEVSGNSELIGVRANKVKINTVSGTVEFRGTTPELSVNTVSGKVFVANEMLLYKSVINTVSGRVDCYIRDEHRQNFSVSGMIKQHAKGRNNGEQGTALKINTVSGGVKVADLGEL